MLTKTTLAAIIAFLCIISACKASATTVTKVNTDNLIKHVTFLTTTEGYRTYDNLKALNASAAYIKDQFEEYGLKTEEQPFEIDGRQYKNIITTVGDPTKPIVVIGAHYDVYGPQDGADDNASGVAGLLELARVLAPQADSLNNHIILVGYTLEERPYFLTNKMGSAIHADSLNTAGKKIKFMVSLEMIGFFSDKENSQRYPAPILAKIFPSTGNYIALVGNIKANKYLRGLKKSYLTTTELPAEVLSAPKNLKIGLDRSDHRNYWKHNYNGIMITDTAEGRNPYYHSEKDTMDILDFDRMNLVIQGLANYLTALPE